MKTEYLNNKHFVALLHFEKDGIDYIYFNMHLTFNQLIGVENV